MVSDDRTNLGLAGFCQIDFAEKVRGKGAKVASATARMSSPVAWCKGTLHSAECVADLSSLPEIRYRHEASDQLPNQPTAGAVDRLQPIPLQKNNFGAQATAAAEEDPA